MLPFMFHGKKKKDCDFIGSLYNTTTRRYMHKKIQNENKSRTSCEGNPLLLMETLYFTASLNE